MRLPAIMLAAAILSIGLVRPLTVEAQTMPPTRFPRPVVVEPQRPIPVAIPVPVRPPVGEEPPVGVRAPIGEQPPIAEWPSRPSETEGTARRRADGFGGFLVAGGAIGMLAGIAWGIRETATCTSCSPVPGGEIFAGMIGGMGYGMLAGVAVYVVTATVRR